MTGLSSSPTTERGAARASLAQRAQDDRAGPHGVKAAVRAQRPRRLLLGVGNHARQPTRRRVAALHKKRDEDGARQDRVRTGQAEPGAAFDWRRCSLRGQHPRCFPALSPLPGFTRARQWVSLAAAAVPNDVLPPSLFQAAHTATVQGRARVQRHTAGDGLMVSQARKRVLRFGSPSAGRRANPIRGPRLMDRQARHERLLAVRSTSEHVEPFCVGTVAFLSHDRFARIAAASWSYAVFKAALPVRGAFQGLDAVDRRGIETVKLVIPSVVSASPGKSRPHRRSNL